MGGIPETPDATPEPTPEQTTYALLCTLLVHMDRYFGCKVKEKPERRKKILASMERIYSDHPDIKLLVESARVDIEDKIARGGNGQARRLK